MDLIISAVIAHPTEEERDSERQSGWGADCSAAFPAAPPGGAVSPASQAFRCHFHTGPLRLERLLLATGVNTE